MVRLAALLVCGVPAALAAVPQTRSLRGDAQRATRKLDPEHSSSMSMTPDDTDREDSMYKRIGCFADDKNDRVLGRPYKSDMMTSEVCAEHCISQGSTYMATQFGRECWCSSSVDLDYERHGGEAVCNILCAGDATMPEEERDTCGGLHAFDLYELPAVETSTDPEYMECYADKKDDRVMGHMIMDAAMTNAVCRTHCEDKEALYYATQYGSECWCGTSDVFDDYEKHGPGTCTMPCSGEPSVACGGRNSFSLFRFMDGMPVDSTEMPGLPTDLPMLPTASPSKPCEPVPPTEPPMNDDSMTNDDFDTSSGATDSPVDETEPSMTDDDYDTSSGATDPPVKPTDAPVKPTDAPVKPTDPPVEPTDPPATPSEDGAGEFQDLLDLHNAVRCMHGSGPLTWSETVASTARSWGQVLSGMCEMDHNDNRDGYGENLYMCWGSASGCYDAGGALKSWYDGETSNRPSSSYGGHATQVLWKSTSKLGCALASCQKGGDTHEILICNYDPPGNWGDEQPENVFEPSKSAAECGYA